MKRVILAFIVGPLLGSLVFIAAVGLLMDAKLNLDNFGIFPPFSYLGLLVAVPCFPWFRRKRWDKWWQSVLLGASIGTLIAVIYSILAWGISGEHKGLVLAMAFFVPWASSCALVFWWIGVHKNPHLYSTASLT